MANLTDECQALYESASDVLFDQDFAGRLTRANRSFERAIGVSRCRLVGSPIYDRIAPEHRDAYRQRILERLGGAPSIPFEIDFVGASTRICLEVRLELTFTNGIPTGVRGVGRDITSQVRSHADRAAADLTLLRQTEELATFSRYLQLLHRLSTTTYATLDDLYSDYLSTGCQIFSLERGAIVEMSDGSTILRKSVGRQNSEMLSELVDRVCDEQETVVGTLPGRSAPGGAPSFFTGTPVFIEERIFAVLLFWSESSIETHPQAREMIEMMARGMESAIQQRRLTDELEHRARHDSLTGLANRSTLAEKLQSAIQVARARGELVGVVFLDLDRFKEINDSLGHATGDVALQEIARRFRDAAGERILVARVGGDEFAAVVPSLRTDEEAAEAAALLMGSLFDPLLLNGHYRSVTASSGVAVYPRDGENGSDLLVKADAAMYEGKQAGGNQMRVASVHAGSAG